VGADRLGRQVGPLEAAAGGYGGDGVFHGGCGAEGKADAEVVIGDVPAGLGGGGLDAVDAGGDLLRSDSGGQPAVAEAADAALGGLAAAAEPDREGAAVDGLHGEGGVAQPEVAAFVGDVVL